MSLEHTILSNLVLNERFARQVLPFIKTEYFADKPDQVLFNLLATYVARYGSFPSKESLAIDLSNVENIGEQDFRAALAMVQRLEVDAGTLNDWLVDETEKWCQQRALHNAIREAVGILDDRTGKTNKNAIPNLLSTALAVSFDSHVGHDFIEDAEARFAYYHRRERKIAFDIDLLNRATNGGVERKTLNIISGGTGVGKTTLMCHMAGHNLLSGLNVLYITLELSEEKTAERVDCNLLDISIEDLPHISKEVYDRKMAVVKKKTAGRLIIKEYPTTQAGANHFRFLMQELKMKRNFTPDVVYVDYINNCASSRIKMAGSKMYEYIKSVAEELRGLAVESNVCMWSATQLNRQGFMDSDPGLEHTSDSFGLPMTADFMIIITQPEELEQLDQIMVKQTTKNRYADPGKYRRFILGLDRKKMRLYDVEAAAQDDLIGRGYAEEEDRKAKFAEFR